jgi:dUTP pyrophosphatase
LSIEIPAGYEGQIRSRSGMAAKWGVVVINSPGTIDSGYKGEIKVALINHSNDCYRVNAGDRIAQLVIAPVIRADFNETTSIAVVSERGEGGFGSSGN